MSHRVVCWFVVVTGLIVSGLAVGADDGPPQEQAEDARTPARETAGTSLATGGVAHGSSEGGLAAFLLGDGGQFAVSEPISFGYGLISVNGVDADGSREAVSVLRPFPAVDPHNGSWFSVIGPDGEELPYRGPYVSWAAIKGDQKVSLWPGEFTGRTMEVNLLFDFSQPGEYRLQWHHGWDSPGLVSNEIRIEIVPADEAE